MTARVSMLLKSRASLTYFRACFLPGRVRTYQHPGKLISSATFNAIKVQINHFSSSTIVSFAVVTVGYYDSYSL